jgi:PAS domain S-box-containing protein
VEDTAERTWAAVERARMERALAEIQADARLSEGRYRLLHDSMRDAFVQVDMEGSITDCNDAFTELVGYSRDELTALTYQDLTPERWHATEEDIVREEILVRGYSRVYEKEYRRKDGSLVPVELRTILLRNDDGRPLAMWAIVRDIGERRAAEQTLRALQERQEFLLELSDALRSLREPLEIQAVTSRLLGERLGADRVGYAEPQADGSSAIRRTYARGVSSMEGVFEPSSSSPALLDLFRAGRTVAHADIANDPSLPDDEKRNAASHQLGAALNVPLLKEGTLVGVLFVHFAEAHEWSADEVSLVEDVAERTWAAVAAARADARLLEQIELTATELERERLARDLHDSVTQSLFAASLKAESLAQSPDVDPRLRQGLEELRRLAVGAMAGMRTMLLEMRDGALEQTPLAGLLRHVVEEAGSRTSVSISLDIEGERVLPPAVRVAAYRVAQEAVTNAIRHAHATSVRVHLLLQSSGVRLRIEDDGEGFPDVPREGHFGLDTMRERAEAVGARCTVESIQGRGTVVELDWREDARE